MTGKTQKRYIQFLGNSYRSSHFFQRTTFVCVHFIRRFVVVAAVRWVFPLASQHHLSLQHTHFYIYAIVCVRLLYLYCKWYDTTCLSFVSTRFCTLNIICMDFYECDYQFLSYTRIQYIHMCLPLKQFASCSLSLFLTLTRSSAVCSHMHAPKQFIHDVFRYKPYEFLESAYIHLYFFSFFNSPYFIWFYYQFNMKVSFSGCSSCEPVHFLHTLSLTFSSATFAVCLEWRTFSDYRLLKCGIIFVISKCVPGVKRERVVSEDVVSIFQNALHIIWSSNEMFGSLCCRLHEKERRGSSN